MQLVIQLSLDNDAFRDEDGKVNYYAVGLTVENVGKDIFYDGLPKDGGALKITDQNGNTVGTIHTTGS